MGFFNDEDEELKPIDPTVRDYLLNKQKESKSLQQDIEDRQSGLGVAQLIGGIGDAIAGRSSAQTAQNFNQVRKDIADNTAKNRLSDPSSLESQNFRRAIEATSPEFVKLYGDSWNQVSAADKDNVFNPLKFKEDRDARIEQMRIYKGQQEENRRDRLQREARERADKKEDKARKDKDLSVAQAKQLGLYNSGILAEQQFSEAMNKKDEYDPTSYGDWIDNSSWMPNFLKHDNAIKAESAQSAWVEAYLRDASGAAIPPSERMAYAKDYFPQPGDPADVVANKAKLRAQKMDNARVAAGVEKEPDVEKYAQAHGLTYEAALAVKRKRTSTQAGR